MVIKQSSNMATTPGHMLNSFVPTPKTFNIGDDIEEFLEEISRFYELTMTQGPVQRTFIKAFLSSDAVKLYEAVDDSIDDYAQRCRRAFEEPANIGKDLLAALQYRKGNESVNSFFHKIDRLADNILRHNLTKENLVSFLLQNAVEDMDVKKEIKIRGSTSNEDMKEIITKMDLIKKELNLEANVAAVKMEKKNYASTAKYNGFQPNRPVTFTKQKAVENNRSRYANSRSFTNSNGSINYYNGRRFKRFENSFPQRPKRCWACKEEGHVRANCPNVKCFQCNRPGHFKHQCYEIRDLKRDYRQSNVAAYDEYSDDLITDDDRTMTDPCPKAKALPREEVVGAIH